jgi:hypothetical protein
MQRARLFVPILLLAAASPLAAQQPDPFKPYDGPRRLELSAGLGYFWSSDWSNLILFESFGATGTDGRQVLMPGLAAAPGAGGQAAITYWKGRLGFRLVGAYAESCVTSATRCGGNRSAPTGGGSPTLAPVEVSLKTYSYGVQGVVGLSEFSESQWFRPYFVVGGGGVTYDPSEALPRFLPTSGNVGPTATVIVPGPTQYAFTVEQAGLESRFAVSFGVGTDFRIPVGPGGLSIRAEVSDLVSQSPLGVRLTRLNEGGSNIRSDRFQQVDLGVGAVHNVRATVGLAIEFGLRQPPPKDDGGFLPFPIPTPPGAKGAQGRSGN